jgi:hypothetical protein
MQVFSVFQKFVQAAPSFATWLGQAFLASVVGVKSLTMLVSILLLTPCCLYLDIVEWTTRKVNRGDSLNTLSRWQWIALTSVVWATVLGMHMPFWYRLLASHPLVVSYVAMINIVCAWGLMLSLCLSKPQRRSLPSSKVLRFCVGEEDGKVTEDAFELTMDAVVILARWTEITRIHAQMPYYLLASLLVIQIVILVARWMKRRKRTIAWTLSQRPVHDAVALEHDCPVHDTCGICLENLCMPLASALPPAYAAGCSRSVSASLALSRCTSSHVRPRAASPRISAARRLRGGTVDYGNRNLATLRCGHRFHAECVAAAADARPSCPTCRAPMDEDGHADVEDSTTAEHIALLAVGVLVMSTSLVLLHAEAKTRDVDFGIVAQRLR